jgi:hypothetical protein
MATDDINFTDKKVDENWKAQVSSEHEGQKPRVPDAAGVSDDKQSSLTFSHFITSLAMQALIHFGEIENPATQKKSKNLDAAKELIDLLVMIKQKTNGNLTQSEIQLFDSILADLQMKSVQTAG